MVMVMMVVMSHRIRVVHRQAVVSEALICRLICCELMVRMMVERGVVAGLKFVVLVEQIVWKFVPIAALFVGGRHKSDAWRRCVLAVRVAIRRRRLLHDH